MCAEARARRRGSRWVERSESRPRPWKQHRIASRSALSVTVVLMLVAYFDESGTTDRDDVALIGGLVADLEYWRELEAPWKAILNRFGIGCYHAVDCEHRNGEFEPSERPIREAITVGLTNELCKVPFQGFVSAVYREDYRFSPAEIRRRTMNDPLYLAFELCLQQISSYSISFADSEKIDLIFARHNDYQENERAIHTNYLRQASTWGRGIGSIEFGDPAESVPLQAADLISYESYRYYCGQRRKPVPPRRLAWKYIEQADRGMSLIIHDLESLQNIRVREPT
jgi:hypothetical protein